MVADPDTDFDEEEHALRTLLTRCARGEISMRDLMAELEIEDVNTADFLIKYLAYEPRR